MGIIQPGSREPGIFMEMSMARSSSKLLPAHLGEFSELSEQILCFPAHLGMLSKSGEQRLSPLLILFKYG